MQKSVIALFALGFSLCSLATAHADTNSVCIWSDKTGSHEFYTDGYHFGGSSFSSLDECGIALRSTLLVLNFGQGDSTGIINFTDQNGKKSTCAIQAQHYPFTSPSDDFLSVMKKAYDGNSSVTEISKYRPYIDENLSISCP